MLQYRWIHRHRWIPCVTSDLSLFTSLTTVDRIPWPTWGRYAVTPTGQVHGVCWVVRTRTNYSRFPNYIALMPTVQTPRQIPNFQFRVLVLGRANAGKTSILQRVCDTTESPTIYRRGKHGRREKVRGPHVVCESNAASLRTTGSSYLTHR